MATATQATAPAMPSPEDMEKASATLLHGVYAPIFFAKLAAYGIQPANDAEARSLLALGASLASAEQSAQTKSASGNRFEQAAANLDVTIKSAGASSNELLTIAKEFAAQPEFAKAAQLLSGAAA